MSNHERALDMAKSWLNDIDATLDPMLIVQAYLDLTARYKALKAAADRMEDALEECISDAYIPHDYKAMRMDVKDALTAYRKLKESNPS
jgi:hypothetical protein